MIQNVLPIPNNNRPYLKTGLDSYFMEVKKVKILIEYLKELDSSKPGTKVLILHLLLS